MKKLLLIITELIYLCFFIAGCSNNKISYNNPFKNLPLHVEYTESSASIIPTSYLIGPSDEIEISYYIDPEFSLSQYLIEIEDSLRIDFYYYPEISRIVKVRLDGYITLPRVGEIKAVGEAPDQLAQKISKLFEKYLSRPVITVEVTGFNAKIDSLKKAISTSSRGQAKHVIVRPDGRISLPYLKNDLMASGKTISELREEIEKKYRRYINALGVSVSLQEAHSYQACVLGDVEKAGCYPLGGPISLLQLIARAGNFTTDANIQQIIMIRRQKDGRPQHRIINVEEILEKGENDPIIHQYDVVYIPRSRLADIEKTAKALWEVLPLRFNYGLDQLWD